LHILNKKTEVLAVLAVYLVFLLIGVFSGQMTFTVKIFGTADGAHLECPPVQLGARVTVRGDPASNVTARFTVRNSGTGEISYDVRTDKSGVAELVLPVTSGDYVWHVSAVKRGYPTIVSRSTTFSLRLVLVVDGLTPSSNLLAVSPATFKARVRDINDRSVDSANVTFYIDSAAIGSSMSNPKGIAELSHEVAPGMHTWFASACKDDQGGISETTSFLVGQAAALPTDKLETGTMKELSRLGRSYPYTLTGSSSGYPSAIMMMSWSALREKLRIERMT
jgi:hypothetical protein